MSRSQRRDSGKPGSRASLPRHQGGTPLIERLPVRFLGGVAVILAVAGLITYLIVQAGTPTEGLPAGERAATDDNPDLPGTFVASQGGRHLSYNFTRSHTPVPYCEGIAWSGAPVATSTASPTVTPTATATETPHGEADVHDEPAQRDDCYASNPPSSGAMLGGGRGVEVISGAFMDFPPAPDVYPRDIDLPREAITHSLEHAGVFIGYNCASDDESCWQVVDELEDIANNRIDNYDDRVTMGYFSDLPVGEIGLSAWTRYDRFAYTEFDRKRVERFLSTHSCRYDEEGFC